MKVEAAIPVSAPKFVDRDGSQDRAAANPRRRWEAADTLIAISVGLVVIIFAIFALLCVQGYNTVIENTKTRSLAAANIVAEETRWVVASALTLANGTAGAFGGDPAQASADTLQRFENVTAGMPTVLALGVYDSEGNKLAEASSERVPASIAGEDFFEAVAGGEDWSLSAQQADAANGNASFGVIKRLGRSGSFTGAVLISIDAKVLENFAEPQNLGAGSTISIVRKDGWVIARFPSLATPLNLKGTASYDNLIAGDAGSYPAISPADGTSRMVSYRHVPELGYIAIASVSMQTALAPLWSSIWIVGFLIGPIALALLAGSLMTARLLCRTVEASRSLSTALAHNEVLFREIHHRVKNNLQSVASLLQLQPIPREIKADMSQRIAAMSAVHEHIYRSNTFETVWVRDYLHTLVENIRAGYAPKVRVVEQFEDVAVDKDAATPLGLIVNEVVSNAFKHAFPDGREGTVTISLKAEGASGRLTVSDDGVGFDPQAQAKGIGRRLIGALTQQLGGESSHVSDNGSVFTLTFPLARTGTDRSATP
ncbi:MAG: histidine kinase dimerization/phosphoacceptor domain -containing protein [Devosia sp.]